MLYGCKQISAAQRIISSVHSSKSEHLRVIRDSALLTTNLTLFCLATNSAFFLKRLFSGNLSSALCFYNSRRDLHHYCSQSLDKFFDISNSRHAREMERSTRAQYFFCVDYFVYEFHTRPLSEILLV